MAEIVQRPFSCFRVSANMMMTTMAEKFMEEALKQLGVTTATLSTIISKRDHRIDLRRPLRGDVTGRQRNPWKGFKVARIS
jgi:hypothetical protein